VEFEERGEFGRARIEGLALISWISSSASGAIAFSVVETEAPANAAVDAAEEGVGAGREADIVGRHAWPTR
jgi:hypothetical protein